MSPSPGVPHQRASRRFANLLDAAAQRSGARVEVLEAVNILVPSGLLIPDICVVDADAAAEARSAIDADAVLCVVEIASRSTKTADTSIKPALYAPAGIEGYWRLDLTPATKLTVTQLERGRYVTQASVAAGTVARISRPFPLELDPAELTRR
jgi:Uma2 family endonuclease